MKEHYPEYLEWEEGPPVTPPKRRLLWDLQAWWRWRAKPWLLQRCIDCHKVEVICGRRVGKHEKCIPF